MNYGEYIMFDPDVCCTQNNTTNDTRISMDIRVITKNNLANTLSYRSTGRQKCFYPGNYFYKVQFDDECIRFEKAFIYFF